MKLAANLLRVWAKNQLRCEIFEKFFEFIYENFYRKLIFNRVLSDLPGPMSLYTALAINIIFLQQFFCLLGGMFPTPPPCGRQCELYNHLNI